MAALLLSGCATNGVVTDAPVVIDTGCLWTRPIYVSRSQDQLSEETASAILVHNQTWQRRCQRKTPD